MYRKGKRKTLFEGITGTLCEEISVNMVSFEKCSIFRTWWFWMFVPSIDSEPRVFELPHIE